MAPGEGHPVMLGGIYIAIFSAFTLVSCVLAFLVGRCARKLPFLDDRIPWTMRRDQAPRAADDTWTITDRRAFAHPPVRDRELPWNLDPESAVLHGVEQRPELFR